MNLENKSSKGRFAGSSGNKENILLKGGTILNVYSGELLKMDIAIKGEKIWYVGPSSDVVSGDTQVLDVSNKILVPGYIDPHFHPWFTYNPVSFGEEALVSRPFPALLLRLFRGDYFCYRVRPNELVNRGSGYSDRCFLARTGHLNPG